MSEDWRVGNKRLTSAAAVASLVGVHSETVFRRAKELGTKQFESASVFRDRRKMPVNVRNVCYLSMKDACEALNIAEYTLYRALEADKLDTTGLRKVKK